MNAPRIREYRATDLDPILEVWRRATVIAHPFQTEDELDRDEALIRGELIQQTETWIAELDGDTVGFLSLIGTRIVAVFIEPALHRSGVGSALIAHVNERHGPLTVEVFESNERGIAFYRRNGFEHRVREDNPLYPDQAQWVMGQAGAP